MNRQKKLAEKSRRVRREAKVEKRRLKRVSAVVHLADAGQQMA